MKNFVQKILALCILVLLCLGWTYSKFERHPDGANNIEELSMDGEYYVVTGADLHNLGGELLKKKIKVRVTYDMKKLFPLATAYFLVDDCYFIAVGYHGMANVPPDLKMQISRNGIMRNDKITLYGTLDFIMPEEGITRNILQFKNGILSPVYDFKRGWD